MEKLGMIQRVIIRFAEPRNRSGRWRRHRTGGRAGAEIRERARYQGLRIAIVRATRVALSLIGDRSFLPHTPRRAILSSN